MAGDEFSELLGRLKERSGLSYGVLGKRLHTSASTLHRYVNGDAVPTDYAPVERFARVCKATPEELVELHRRWVLADARRGEKSGGGRAAAEEEPRARTAAEAGGRAAGAEAGAAEAGSGAAEAGSGAAEAGSGAAEAGSGAAEAGSGAAEAGSGAAGTASGATEAGAATETAGARNEAAGARDEAAGAGNETAEPDAVAESGPEGERRPRTEAPVARRRTVVLAGAAVVAALVSAALVVNLVSGQGDDEEGGKESMGVAASRSVAGSPGASESADAKGSSSSPSTSPSASRKGSPSASASASRSGGGGAAQGGGFEDGATAPTVAVNPYKWENPCSQHYLVDRQPEQVPPPPGEPDARGWVTALGGVAAGQQMLALTVQGTGKATVVLEEMHVRVVEKSAPLAWNDFTMGVGCGGGVETTSFGVNLDAGRPALSPKAGQRDFPYKVSESDPEVFYVFADARTHNVSWYLELDWSSGDRQGTLRIDDNGKPFRTSGNVGRPAYNYPLGSSEWGRDEYDPDIPG